MANRDHRGAPRRNRGSAEAPPRSAEDSLFRNYHRSGGWLPPRLCRRNAEGTEELPRRNRGETEEKLTGSQYGGITLCV